MRGVYLWEEVCHCERGRVFVGGNVSLQECVPVRGGCITERWCVPFREGGSLQEVYPRGKRHVLFGWGVSL